MSRFRLPRIYQIEKTRRGWLIVCLRCWKEWRLTKEHWRTGSLGKGGLVLYNHAAEHNRTPREVLPGQNRTGILTDAQKKDLGLVAVGGYE